MISTQINKNNMPITATQRLTKEDLIKRINVLKGMRETFDRTKKIQYLEYRLEKNIGIIKTEIKTNKTYKKWDVFIEKIVTQ